MVAMACMTFISSDWLDEALYPNEGWCPTRNFRVEKFNSVKVIAIKMYLHFDMVA